MDCLRESLNSASCCSLNILADAAASATQEEVGQLTEPAKRPVATLDMIPLERFVPISGGWVGRPLKARRAIASAFVAKAMQRDAPLRRICGWQRAQQVPHESTLSRGQLLFVTSFASRSPRNLIFFALVSNGLRGIRKESGLSGS